MPKMRMPPIAHGQIYGMLTAIEKFGSDKGGHALWRFSCSCGGETIARASSARYGLTGSCGCRNPQISGKIIGSPGAKNGRYKHGRSHTVTYRIWRKMCARCIDPADSCYPEYGGRGIRVCDRWKKFENFLADMGERPVKMSLDRKDGTRGYEPENCRWATSVQQARNTSRNKFVEFRGQTMTLAEACQITGIKYNTSLKRLRRGKSVEDAIGA